MGVAQVKLARREELVRVLPAWRYAVPCWMVMHKDQACTPRIRALSDHLKTALSQWM